MYAKPVEMTQMSPSARAVTVGLCMKRWPGTAIHHASSQLVIGWALHAKPVEMTQLSPSARAVTVGVCVKR